MKKLCIIMLCTTTLFVMTSGKLFNRNKGHNHREIVNTLEDLREWITFDVEEQRTDSVLGATYLENIDQIISDLQSAR